MTGRYKAYPEYKESGVEWIGSIPSHWTLKKLKYLAPLVSEKATNKTNPIALEHIQSWTGKLIPTKSKFEGDGTKFKAGDILFGKLRPYLAKVYLTKEDGEAIGDFHVMRPVSYDYGNFLKSLMLTTDYISTVDASTYGAKMPRASWDFTSNIQLPFCPELEAKKIANFLDHETAKIDTLITKQEKLIELLKEKRQAVISHAVTKGISYKGQPDAPMKDSGVEWLGEVPEHWDCLAISKATQKITNGYVGPTRDILVESGVPYIQATHIKKGRVNFNQAYYVRESWSLKHSKSILKENDVLVVQTGAGTGDTGLVSKEEEGFNCHALIILQPRREVLLGGYLALVLRSDYGVSRLFSIRTGGMHPHLNCGEVQFVKIPLPPIEEQSNIITYIQFQLEKISSLEDKVNQAIHLMKERKIALISAVVTGKIDVRDWVESDEVTNG